MTPRVSRKAPERKDRTIRVSTFPKKVDRLYCLEQEIVQINGSTQQGPSLLDSVRCGSSPPSAVALATSIFVSN